MAVREFNGTTDYCRLSIGGLGSMTYGTFALLAKVTSTADSKTLFCFLNSGQGYVYTPAQVYGGSPTALHADGPDLIDPLPTGVWLLLVIRKTTGTTTFRTSYYNFTTTTWAHVNATATRADWTAPTGGFVTTATDGGASECFAGRMAVTAAWSNSLPWSADSTGDTAIESAGLITSLSSWVSAAPSALWPWDPAVATGITDLIGSANQAFVSGTTQVTGDDPPGFSFSLAPPPPLQAAVQAAGPWPCF